MRKIVDTRDPMAVAACVRRHHLEMFPGSDVRLVATAFSRAMDCFTGRDPEYLPIDARYHDLEHTLQGALCFSTLLLGRHRARVPPILSERWFERGLMAMLLHDTGYLKHHRDNVGTGAKYTFTHVQRSCDFAERLLARLGHDADVIGSVQRMIRCTGVGGSPDPREFSCEEERICGFALGSADFLGQMAADDYVEKLPVLYEEFREAWAHQGLVEVPFSSAEDLIRRTPDFWNHLVLPRLEGEFMGLYHFLAEPPGTANNPYLIRIQANLARLSPGGQPGMGSRS